MPRPERNGVCSTCNGKARYYPPVDGAVHSGEWAHLERADWIKNPHPVTPTEESIAAAQAEPSTV